MCSDHAFGVSERLGYIALFVLACLRRYSLRMNTHDEIAVLWSISGVTKCAYIAGFVTSYMPDDLPIRRRCLPAEWEISETCSDFRLIYCSALGAEHINSSNERYEL